MKTIVAVSLLAACSLSAQDHKTRNIIFVMTDGLRWQDVFNGVDPALLNKESGVPNVEATRKLYWRDSVAARREALMPFLWTTMAKNGQLYGNRSAGSEAYVTNGKNFSYPGYNETLTGSADPRVDSNGKKYNQNVTVLEWLHNKPAFKGRIAAFGAWDTFPFIFNAPRAGFPVNAGHDPFTGLSGNARVETLNLLKQETRIWDGEALDSFTFHTAHEYLKSAKPRVLYLSLGETDEWAHDGKYALYLQAARRVDQYLKQLWETAQSIPQYRGSTTLIFSVDHGRGEAPVQWKSHGERVPDSRYIWMSFLGPDTPALGERKNVPAVTQSQIAATLSALLGEDYRKDKPSAGAVMGDVIK